MTDDRLNLYCKLMLTDELKREKTKKKNVKNISFVQNYPIFLFA